VFKESELRAKCSFAKDKQLLQEGLSAKKSKPALVLQGKNGRKE